VGNWRADSVAAAERSLRQLLRGRF